MSILDIKPASREGAHLLISLTAPSGGGKTHGAIVLARGLVGEHGRIGFLDTESGRGKFNAGLTRYEHADLTPPFSPQRYREAVGEFVASKVDALIIDSFSHEWEGIGGCHEIADATGRDGLLKWAAAKAQHKKLMNDLLQAPIHIILCLRARERFVQVPDPDKKGKQMIVSAGWHEITERNVIFEMTVSILLLTPTQASLTKCPDEIRPIFDQLPITVDTGRRLAAWVAGGAPVDHDIEALKREAVDIAGMGKAPFGQWWNSDKIKPLRAALRAGLANYQSIAEEADRMAALAAGPE